MVVSFLFWGCGYDDFDTPNISSQSDELPNGDIATLRRYYYGDDYEVGVDMVVSGVVTANDGSGNLYRSFIIEDDSGAAEIYAGTYDLHNAFKVGQRVTVLLNGCAVCEYRGVMRIGLPSEEWDRNYVRPFGVRAFLDRHVMRGEIGVSVEPTDVDVADFAPELCGRLVRISDVELAPDEANAWFTESEDDYYASDSCVKPFCTSSGDVLYVVTSRYADFAREHIPEGRCTLTGILMYGKFGTSSERYALMLRDLNDVQTY